MKPTGRPEQVGFGEEPKSRVRRTLAHILCNVNDTCALIGLCLLVTSHLGQIPDPWHSQAFTRAHIVVGLSLHIQSLFTKARYFSSSTDCTVDFFIVSISSALPYILFTYAD